MRRLLIAGSQRGSWRLGRSRSFSFGDRRLAAMSSGAGHALLPVSGSPSPNTTMDALAFAVAMRATRAIDTASSLHDAVYTERFTRLLPTYTITPSVDDNVVLGTWLTGGAAVSATSTRRLQQMLTWMSATQLAQVVSAAGLHRETTTESPITESPIAGTTEGEGSNSGVPPDPRPDRPLQSFELPGRAELEQFFNEHIVDVVRHKERYKALGIGFPGAIVLHGPPGCGKTFAIDQLIEFLGWPSFRIEASTVASPYIHETSRKVSDVFDRAIKSAPSVIVIDEMDAFLAERDAAGGQHRVEEVAEFLRRIPEATKNEVLVVAMTNRIDMVDAAILRRGRFDHVIKVDPASVEEVQALLDKLLQSLPKAADIDTAHLAEQLQGRPLSDVAFVVREAGRLAARSGESRLERATLAAALKSVLARAHDSGNRRIGFSSKGPNT